MYLRYGPSLEVLQQLHSSCHVYSVLHVKYATRMQSLDLAI